MALQLSHPSAEFTLDSHGVSIGHLSVSLTVKHLSSEHQPCVRTGACRNVHESTCHCMQPTIALPMQFAAMLFVNEITLSFQQYPDLRAQSVQLYGYVQNETPTALS